MEISVERADELGNIVTECVPAVEAATILPREKANVIQRVSRVALGLSPDMDICDIQEPTRSEVLHVMRKLRDRVSHASSNRPWINA